MSLREPEPGCLLCERLAAYRGENSARFPGWHNASVPSFGPLDARLLVVGLAPGLRGANRMGRPFTGDAAGELLYSRLLAFGFASGSYAADPGDGLRLIDCRITNAVRCLPPGNKPLGREVKSCRVFLASEIGAMTRLEAILALGRLAHDAVLAALGRRRSQTPFRHGAAHPLEGGILLADSYHCSRYNTQTGRLTPTMFDDVFAGLRTRLGAAQR